MFEELDDWCPVEERPSSSGERVDRRSPTTWPSVTV